MTKDNGKIEGRVIRDSDGMVAYHYIRNGSPFRKVLFQIDKCGDLIIKDPGSGKFMKIGRVFEVEGATLYVFF